jgi:hypothetical protein
MARVKALSHLAAAAGVFSIAVAAASTAGCAKLHARAIGPALETPAPPPRAIAGQKAPIEGQPLVASQPVGEVEAPTPAAIKPQDTPAAPVPAPPPAVAPPPVAAAERPTPPAPEAPPPTLQTTANQTAAEQRTRTSLANATRDLGRIDVRSLSADAKAQYDIARRFVAQASDALGSKNFEFAQQLADKAATLAALLQRR